MKSLWQPSWIGWDRRTWLLGLIASNLLGATEFIRQKIRQYDSSLFRGDLHIYSVIVPIWSAWVCFLRFLWGLMPLGALWFWDRLTTPAVLFSRGNINQLAWAEEALLRYVHLSDEWPQNDNDAVLFLLLCLLLTSGPISLTRWLLKRSKQKQWEAQQQATPQEGVWPPSPNVGQG